MRKMMALASVALGLLLAFTVPVGAEGDDGGNYALVVFDLGDGTVKPVWVDVGQGGMDGLNATIKAGETVGYVVNYSTSEYGAFVNAIGGKAAKADYSEFWNLLVWNASNGTWEASSVGISSITLTPGEYICWYYGAWGNVSSFDPNTVRPPGEHEPSVSTGNTTEESGGRGEGEGGGFIPFPWEMALVSIAGASVVWYIVRERQ